MMIGVGGYYMIQVSFTPGDVVLFRAYWWRLFGPVQTLARVNDMVQKAIAAGRRVFEVLDAPDELPDRPDAVPVTRASGALELNHVTFAYDTTLLDSKDLSPNAPPVLDDVTLRIHPGKTVALCGPSGSGKTTILNLLLRFYDPVRGQVTLDGSDLRSFTKESLRKHFALVQQE